MPRRSRPFEAAFNENPRDRPATTGGTVPLSAAGMAVADKPVARVLPNQQDGKETGHEHSKRDLDNCFTGRSHGCSLLSRKFFDERLRSSIARSRPRCCKNGAGYGAGDAVGRDTTELDLR